MIRKFICAVSSAAIMLSLSSCAGNSDDSSPSERVADFKAEYGDFFDYTFNGDYTINIGEEGTLNEDTDREQAYRSYDISYVRKDGTERNERIVSREFTEEEKEYYESEQRMNNEEINAFCIDEIREVFVKELIDNILSKYLDITYKEGEMIYSGDEYKCSVGLVNPNYLFSIDSDDYEKGCRLVDSHISPETGYKLSDADLKSAANDREFLMYVSFTINTGTDLQPYIKKMEAIISDYFAYAGAPKNCSFVIKETADGTVGTTKTVYNRNFLMGEEIDVEEKKKENGEFKIQREITRICLEE